MGRCFLYGPPKSYIRSANGRLTGSRGKGLRTDQTENTTCLLSLQCNSLRADQKRTPKKRHCCAAAQQQESSSNFSKNISGLETNKTKLGRAVMIPIRSASITLTERQTNNMTTARSRGNGSINAFPRQRVCSERTG
jgi:hypothetical protein